MFGLWSLLVIVFCVWFLFGRLYESWLTYQSRVGIENGIDAFSNENLSRMSFISDRNPRFGSVGTIYQTGNISYILSDSWNKSLGTDDSEKYNEIEICNEYTIFDGGITYSVLNIIQSSVSIDEPKTFIESTMQNNLKKHMDEENYKSIFNHITIFYNKPAFEELYITSKGIYYDSYFFANDKLMYVYLWLNNHDIEYSKHLVEFYAMLSSIQIENENIFPLKRSNDIYNENTYFVGRDIDAGRYSLVGYDKGVSCLLWGNNCVAGQKKGSQDVYLVNGMLVSLGTDCALIKYE